MDRFVLNVKELRQAQNITQKDLSQLSGVSSETIKLMESPEGCNPTLATVNRLAAYFKVSIDGLIKEKPNVD